MSGRSIYFFLIPEHVSRDNYAHNALVLAEGLLELGWRIFANINYWKSGPDDEGFLFRHDPAVQPSDCDVNVLTYDWLHFVNVVPFEIAENKRSLRIYLEDDGGLRPPGFAEPFRAFDLILKSHFNRRTPHPSNYRPWSFGISRRILAETAPAAPFSARRRALLVNFGATHSYRHHLRKVFEQRVYRQLGGWLELDRTTNNRTAPPVDRYHRLMWEQTAYRHYPDYYERLRNSAACTCVGGQLAPGLPEDWSLFDGSGGLHTRLHRWWCDLASQLGRDVPRWSQWESWRFWESLSAGCAALLLDFDKYGIQLPVQPENWTHYIGLDLDHLPRDLDRLRSDQGALAKVADAGRVWAHRHYSPAAKAERFVSMIDR